MGLVNDKRNGQTFDRAGKPVVRGAIPTGKGAELGLLIKGGEALERSGRVDTVILDKTGTVTTGRP